MDMGFGNTGRIEAYNLASGTVLSGSVVMSGNPHGLALNRNSSTMYVLMWADHDIRKITMNGNALGAVSGEPTSVAGNQGSAGFADGVGSSASLCAPCSRAIRLT
jgi:hypothetical protein